MKPTIKVTALGAVLALSACSFLQTDKVDYRSTVRTPTLEIPPDLTQLSKETRYTVVDGAISAAASKAVSPAAKQSVIGANTVGDIRVERSGNQRWLVVKRPADKLWQPVKDFWKDSGFLLTMDQMNIGIMETDWAENRAKIPQDFIRATLGKLLDSLYSTAERDKFRTRLETNATGETEIYISHRGMTEVDTSDKTGTVWKPRPSDPELEAEFLRRLMENLGASPEVSQALLAVKATDKPLAVSAVINGQPVVQIQDGFETAWRRVGLALDRTGFTVEDRDRKQGIYFVRYVVPTTEAKESGFFSKWFSSAPKAPEAAKYQIAVRSQGDTTTVSVLDAKGAPEKSDGAQRIVKVIADDIK